MLKYFLALLIFWQPALNFTILIFCKFCSLLRASKNFHIVGWWNDICGKKALCHPFRVLLILSKSALALLKQDYIRISTIDITNNYRLVQLFLRPTFTQTTYNSKKCFSNNYFRTVFSIRKKKKTQSRPKEIGSHELKQESNFLIMDSLFRQNSKVNHKKDEERDNYIGLQENWRSYTSRYCSTKNGSGNHGKTPEKPNISNRPDDSITGKNNNYWRECCIEETCCHLSVTNQLLLLRNFNNNQDHREDINSKLSKNTDE